MTIKSAIMTSVLAASLVTSVFATEASTDKPLPQFTAADTHVLFEQNTQSMQLAALSQQEMKETKGAGFNFQLARDMRYVFTYNNINPDDFNKTMNGILSLNSNLAKRYFDDTIRKLIIPPFK